MAALTYKDHSTKWLYDWESEDSSQSEQLGCSNGDGAFSSCVLRPACQQGEEFLTELLSSTRWVYFIMAFFSPGQKIKGCFVNSFVENHINIFIKTKCK